MLTLAEAARSLGLPPAAEVAIAGGSIDSRAVRPGDLFFALPGERADGHDYVSAALAAGAAAAVIESRRRDRFAPAYQARLLAVESPLEALQHLAAEARRKWGGTLIGITGSAGKTTTKEMIAAALEARYRVLKTEGNLNNHLGVPLTLLRLTRQHEMAVVEMGMNHAGEIARLAAIARPNAGVVTNVAPVHLGHFTSLDAIAAAKRELIEALPASGIAVLNANDERVARFGAGFAGRSVAYGLADAPRAWAGPLLISLDRLQLEGAAGSSFRARDGEGGEARVRLALPGRHNAMNAGAALATARVFGVGLTAAAAALEGMNAGAGRGRVLQGAGITLLDDCYNANPAAVETMLQVLAATPGKRHLAVLGEMLELGAGAPEWHRQAGRAAAAARLDALFAVQGEAREILAGARAAGFQGEAEFFASAAECLPRLQAALRPGDVVLVKGSHGVRLETLVAALLTLLNLK